MKYVPMDKLTIFALILGLAKELKVEPETLAKRASSMRNLDLYSADLLAALIKAEARQGKKEEK